jgi:branched-chain amino acid transport system permease protein
VLVQNQDELTHGAVGTNAPLLFQAPNLDQKFFWGAIPLLGAVFALSTWIHNSRFGYRLRAIRENENTAMAVGVNPSREKLLSLIPSAVFTALAGSMYASYFSFVGPDTVLTIDISVQAALIAMLGGAATVWGPILGSIVLTLTSEIFKNYFEHTHLVVYGALLIVVVIFLPGGVISLFEGRKRFRRETGPIGSVQG